MNLKNTFKTLPWLFVLMLFAACSQQETPANTSAENTGPENSGIELQGKPASLNLTDEQIENIVRRSYQYVALYNVVNKGAMAPQNPTHSGWNSCFVNTQLTDHNLKIIARPNNDTLYIGCGLDLRKDAFILDIPAFSSKYVSLMTFGYEHYVDVPLTTRMGDFRKPEKILFYTKRTEGYNGEPVAGVDRIVELSSDFSGAVFRVMPHANVPEKFKQVTGEMQSLKWLTLNEYRGGKTKAIDDVSFPNYGKTDADIFGNNLLEVMQFIFNHVTFDENDKLDQAVLAAYEPLGIVPGKAYDAAKAVKIDKDKFREISQQVQQQQFKILATQGFTEYASKIFRPKGRMELDPMVLVSVVGPIGLPVEEASYPAVTTSDGKPMNAQHDYVVRMTKDQLPPATAFWSLTLYDTENGFFIPNERKKYSVGENAGMKLNADGGIEIYVAAKQPEGVPEENWLPIERKDEGLDIILRVYAPDLEKLENWKPPKTEIKNES